MNTNPLVSIIILNWNGSALLEECLDSVLKTEYKTIEIIVIDNGSKDNSLEMLKRYAKQILIFSNKKNIGYTQGNLQGFKAAHGRFLVTLNNDMTVEPSWLEEPINLLLSDSSIGAVSCRQMSYYQKDIVDSLYHYMLPDLTCQRAGFGKRLIDISNGLSPAFVLAANGGSAIYRREMIDEIGGLDPFFYAYWEELDLGMKAFLNGWKTIYAPMALCYHKGSASFNKKKAKAQFYGERNRLIFLFKYFPISIIAKQWLFLLKLEMGMAKLLLLSGMFHIFFLSRGAALFCFFKYIKIRRGNLLLFKKRIIEWEKLFHLQAFLKDDSALEPAVK